MTSYISSYFTQMQGIFRIFITIIYFLRSFMFMTHVHFCLLPFHTPYTPPILKWRGCKHASSHASLILFILPKNTSFLSGWLIQGLPSSHGKFFWEGHWLPQVVSEASSLFQNHLIPTLTLFVWLSPPKSFISISVAVAWLSKLFYLSSPNSRWEWSYAHRKLRIWPKHKTSLKSSCFMLSTW